MPRAKYIFYTNHLLIFVPSLRRHFLRYQLAYIALAFSALLVANCS